ncbi:MAG: A/G-specific adenine glycosylase [Dehalococcoidia bacterium]|jgi:A/G-specific adenine glycosylase|nr:A/G-specific adenine glycosylase [Dehalococcoidia bacterium]
MVTEDRTPVLDDAAVAAFRQRVYDHFEQHGRDFPWRHTTDAYRVLVSEVMLQQTQTARVAPKYEAFIERFPNVATLAAAPADAVLTAWQGLGYNRRALALQAAARAVVAEHGGAMPSAYDALLALPGVGPYTAAAVRAFAFNLPDAFIETNIRTVFIHEFLADAERVRDSELLPLVAQTIDTTNPRRWYQALMDYGAMLKESGNASRSSAHHHPQSRFEGSRRQARGIILKSLLQSGPATRDDLAGRVSGWDARYDEALATLERDGLVSRRDGAFTAAQ